MLFLTSCHVGLQVDKFLQDSYDRVKLLLEKVCLLSFN